jgi:hypothetical protein
MNATQRQVPSGRPANPSLAALLFGLSTFGLGGLAIPLYFSYFGILFGFLLNLAELPLLLATLYFGGKGLRGRERGGAILGLALALLPVLVSVLIFTWTDFALALRDDLGLGAR